MLGYIILIATALEQSKKSLPNAYAAQAQSAHMWGDKNSVSGVMKGFEKQVTSWFPTISLCFSMMRASLKPPDVQTHHDPKTNTIDLNFLRFNLC